MLKPLCLFSALAPCLLACGNNVADLGGAHGSSVGPDGGASEVSNAADDYARTAVFMAGCLGSRTNATLQWLYVTRNTDPFQIALRDPATRACLGSKTNGCDAMRDCLGVELKPNAADPDCDSHCDGNVLVSCGNGAEARRDCARFGGTCSQRIGWATCVGLEGKACTRPNPVSSEGEDPPPTCDDQGRPAECDDADHVQIGPRCSDHGLVCKVDSMFGATCIGSGGGHCGKHQGPTEYTYTGERCLDVRTMEACVGYGLTTLACDDIAPGFTCQSAQIVSAHKDGFQFFCGRASECAPDSDDNGSCDGDTLVLCNAGARARLDCKALGFGRCDSQTGRCLP